MFRLLVFRSLSQFTASSMGLFFVAVSTVHNPSEHPGSHGKIFGWGKKCCECSNPTVLTNQGEHLKLFVWKVLAQHFWQERLFKGLVLLSSSFVLEHIFDPLTHQFLFPSSDRTDERTSQKIPMARSRTLWCEIEWHHTLEFRASRPAKSFLFQWVSQRKRNYQCTFTI